MCVQKEPIYSLDCAYIHVSFLTAQCTLAALSTLKAV
jgi:hypothetical protein